MQKNCTDCLSRDVCEIPGGACRKMGALFSQHKTNMNGRNLVSNTAKNTTSATPKDVKESVEGKVEEKVIPAQSTQKEKAADAVEEVCEAGKLTLLQRAKATAEKLKQNKKALLILTGAAVVVGLTIKNNRKVVAAESQDTEDVTVIDDAPQNTDSL